jgi:hypothetical protein
MAKPANVVQIEQPKPIRYDNSDAKPNARVRVSVRSISALLTHNPESMSAPSGAKKGSRVPDPADEAEAGCYRLSDGSFGIKGIAFRESILEAASSWKAKRVSMKNILSHMTVVEELVQLCHPDDGSPLTSYVIDRRRAIVMRAGIIRARPRFEQWMATFTIEVDPVLVPDLTLIVDICADAGNRKGVGDYRPQRKGWFGRFRPLEYTILN